MATELPTSTGESVPIHFDSRTDNDQLTEAATLFAGNIARLVELGEPEMVKDYLVDVLQDPNDDTPPSERRAAFEFLARQQRMDSHDLLLQAGRELSGDLYAQTEEVRPTLQSLQTKFRVVMERAYEDHRPLNQLSQGRIQNRQSAEIHDRTSVTITGGVRLLSDQVEGLNNWLHSQANLTEDFGSRAMQDCFEEEGIRRAGKSFEPDYEGEKIDLSSVINPATIESSAAKLQAAVLEAQRQGVSVENYLLGVMQQEAAAELLQERTVKNFYSFAESYAANLRKFILGSEDILDEVIRESRHFQSRGREGYPFVRNAGEAEDLYRSQARSLRSIEDDAKAISNRTEIILKHALEQIVQASRIISVQVQHEAQPAEEIEESL